MNRDFTTSFFWPYSAVALALIAIIVQFAGLMNLDNAWLLDVAGRVNAGERLGLDVIETNPPLIIYLMQIPAAFAEIAGISPIHSFIIFMSALLISSLAMTFTMVKDIYLRLWLVFLAAYVPGIVFGEREHIFMLLALPYFATRWTNTNPTLRFAIISGLMAGIGFAIKPFLLLIWGFIELTRLCIDRKLSTVLNLQNFIIGLTTVFYIFYLVFIEQTYINTIFPQIAKYYGAFGTDYHESAKTGFCLFSLFQLPFFIMLFKDRATISRPTYILSMGALAAIILIILQGKSWSNYFYPVYLLGLMANIYLITDVFKNTAPLWNRVAAISATLSIVILIGLSTTSNIRVAFRISDDDQQKIIKIFNQHASGKPVYALGFDLGLIYPALVHSSAVYKGHNGHLWMLPGMTVHLPKQNGNLGYNPPEKRDPEETAMINDVITDFKTNPPEIVIVADKQYSDRKIGKFGFNFIEYFSTEPEFQEIWQNYEKIDKLKEAAVYKRKPQ